MSQAMNPFLLKQKRDNKIKMFLICCTEDAIKNGNNLNYKLKNQ